MIPFPLPLVWSQLHTLSCMSLICFPNEGVHVSYRLVALSMAELTFSSATRSDQHVGTVKSLRATVLAIQTNSTLSLEMRTRLWRRRQEKPPGQHLPDVALLARARNSRRINLLSSHSKFPVIRRHQLTNPPTPQKTHRHQSQTSNLS